MRWRGGMWRCWRPSIANRTRRQLLRRNGMRVQRYSCWTGVSLKPFLPGFRESYPQVLAEQSLYVTDRDRMTSAGGAAAIDMMLHWIGRLLGGPLAVAVADQLVHFRSMEQPSQARLPVAARYGVDDARLLKIISAMEEQSEDPLDAAALAAVAGISLRQMERLFHDKLGQRPMGFYLALRLEKAERLLTYSHMSVRDVSVACGFSSLPLFSRSFKSRYGRPPSSFRAA